jgi:hypothetical protein
VTATIVTRLELATTLRCMIAGYAALFARVGGDADEAAQCGRIALMKAADRHDATRGAFTAYAWHYVYFAMLRSSRATATDGENSVDVPMFDDDVPMVERLPSMWGNPESILIAKEEYYLERSRFCDARNDHCRVGTR